MTNMMILNVLGVLYLHYFLDFLMQNDHMAINKSKDNIILFMHSAINGIGFFIVFGIGVGMVTFISHFIIDYITSRINAKLYVNHRHWFFCMIGFDQLLHYTVALLSISYFNAWIL